MQLHYHPVSVTSRAIWLCIEENQLPVNLVVVDLLKGEHHEAEYVKLNPNRLVPVLEEGDFVLTESSAILKYLADKFDLSSYPKGLQERARVNERMDWLNTQFFREYGYNLIYPQIFPQHKRPSETTQQETLQWGSERARQAMQLLDDHLLADDPYLCGSDLTIADYLGVAMVTAGEHIGVNLDAFPKVKAWLGRMKSLPSWDKVNQVHEGFKASLANQTFVHF